jgi:hypothetical protein
MIKTIIFIILLLSIIVWLDFFTVSWIPISLDSTFFPVYELKWFFSQSFYWHIVDIITIIIWYKIYAKLFIIFTLITWAILGIYVSKLINNVLKISDTKTSFFIRFLWITFISLNPFTYERFITQPWIILWIYLIWFWLVFLINYLLIGKKNYLYISCLFFWFSINIFPHSIIFLVIISIITLLFYFKKFSLKKIIISIWIIILLNFNWIYWNFFLKVSNNISNKIESFDINNIEVFKSNNLNWLWSEITNLLLYWFWGERHRHLYNPELINQKWYLAWFILLIIIIFWIYNLYKKQRKLTYYLITIMIISYILSLWISSSFFSDINKLLYDTIPYYIGMREPQKLTWLIMIIYSIFFLSGIYYILVLINKTKLKSYLSKYIYNYYFWFIIIFLLIIIWSPNVLWGFNWQLKIIKYPNDFFEITYKLKDSPWKTVIFPWHSYMACDWTKWKIIANPLEKLINLDLIISADNIENWSLYTNSNRQISKEIESFLKDKDYEYLRKNKINNIIFMKNCADYNNYYFLEKDSNLEKTFSWESLYIFRVKLEK